MSCARAVTIRGGLTFVVTLTLPSPVAAQGLAPQLGGGLTVPSGEFAGGHGLGLHLHAGLGLPLGGFPLALRADGDLHSLPEKFADGDSRLLSATISGVYDLPAVASFGGGARPYALAGGGFYSLDSSLGGANADAGVQVGLGVAVDALRVPGFLEVRVARVFALPKHYSHVPVTAGIRF